MLWGAVPLLNEWHQMHEEAFDRFIAYKGFVPVCGAIILNEACDKVGHEPRASICLAKHTPIGRPRQRLEELGRLGFSKGKD